MAERDPILVRGSGGGESSASSTPTESPDSLRSRQYAQLVYVISEGEIEGPVNGAKSIFAEGTPLQNSDGTWNFDPVAWAFVPGIQGQPAITGTEGVGGEFVVNVQVTHDSPTTRTINQPVNSIRVTVAIPSLMNQDDKGNLVATTLDYAIDLQTRGGGFIRRISEHIDDKTTSLYQRSYTIDVSGDPPWDVRVVRLTPDSTSASLSNKLYWSSYTLITRDPLAYPNSACIGVRTDARAFSSLPTLGFHCRWKIINVPSNYDPKTRSYSGVWDGSFKRAYSDNPAWVWYDLLTSSRYGLGDDISPELVDKWSLYEIAQWCDQMVPDGKGGTEPRFSCFLSLETRDEALRVLQYMAGAFGGAAYWGTSSVVPTADMPGPVVKRFTRANVGKDGFRYRSTMKTVRHTVALVTWNNPELNYAQDVEPVVNWEGVQRYGWLETEVIALGCKSRGQAHRVGNSILLTELSETETITFPCGTDVAGLFPGAIFETLDPSRAAVRFGGRLADVAEDALTLDAAVTLEVGKTYTLGLISPDGTLFDVAVIPGLSDGQPHTVLNLTAPIATEQVPQQWSIWLLKASDLSPETWRCVGIKEVGKASYEVTGVTYNSAKYDAIDNGTSFDTPNTTYFSTVQDPPSDFTVVESVSYLNSQVAGAQLNVGWVAPMKGASGYSYAWRWDKGSWQSGYANRAGFEITPAQPGHYDFEIRAIGATGRPSRPLTGSYDFTGSGLATAVSNLRLAEPFDSGDAAFTWDAVPGATHYLAEFLDGGGNVLSSQDCATPGIVYSFALNKADHAGFPSRTVNIRVTTYNALGQSTPTLLSVTNAQCGAPTVSVQQIYDQVLITTTAPGGDYAATRMIVSQDPACPVTTTPYYDGPNLAQPSPSLTPGTWYCRAAQYDAFGSDNLAWSTIVAIDVVANVSGTPSVIDASMITAATGSAPPGGDAYYAVYDLATKKLWTWHSELNPARYTSSVSAADITGTIQDAQLSASLIGRVALVDGADTMAGSIAQRVKAEADNRAAADNAQLARIASLESEVSDPTTGLTASANAIDQIETQINDSTNGLSALSTRTSVLEARGAGVNLLPNAAFEVDTASWALGWKQVAGDADASFQRDLAAPDWLPPGMHTLGINRAGTPTGIQDFGCGTVDLIPIEPGKRYCFSGWIASHRSACDLGINFRDANQNNLSETHSANNAGVGGGTDLNNWTRVSVFATAPANACYAYVFLRQYPATDANPYSWLLRPMLERATSTQSQPSSWAPGAASTRALISSVQTALTAVDQANANSINQVSARLAAGGDTYQSIVSAQATATAAANKIAGKYAITIDANGHLTGWTLLDDGSTGSLTIAADKVMFSASSLVADIALQSPAWWGMGTAWPSMVQAVDGNGSGQPLRFFRLFQGGYQDFQGQKIQVNQGGQYRVRLRTFLSPDFAGKIFAGIDFPGVGRACPAPTSTDATWAGGSPFYSQNTISTGAWQTFDGIYTCSVTDWIQPRLTFEITAGYAEVQVEVVRATGTDLVVDGAITAAKIDAAYTNTTVLQAKQAVIDNLAVSSVASKFASMGDLVTGTITLNQDTIGSWAFIRSAGKFWNDGVNGFISAAHSASTSFFQEFKAASGNALVIEQKAAGGSVVGGGGVKYLLHVRSADGVDRIVIDPDGNQYIFRGTIYADAGTFSGTLNAATGTFAGSVSGVSGTFGTITSGYLQNSDGSNAINLNASGTSSFIKAGTKTLADASGATFFNNVFWSQWVAVNKYPCYQVQTGTDSENNPIYALTTGIDFDFDLGITIDVSTFSRTSYSVRVDGWSGTWPSDYTAWRASVKGEVVSVMPAPSESWTGCRLRVRLFIYLTDTSNNVLDSNASNEALSVMINTLHVSVARVT